MRACLELITVQTHLFQLLSQLSLLQAFIGIPLFRLNLLFQLNHQMAEVLHLILLVSQSLIQLGLLLLVTFHTGVESLGEDVVVGLQLINVALHLLSVFNEVLVFLPGEGLVVEGLQLLHHMIVLSLHPGVFLVHHGYLFVLVELVVGH